MFTRFGNAAARECIRRGKKTVWRKIDGEQVTTFSYTEGTDLPTAVKETAEAWVRHSSQPPLWVESDDTELANELAAHFGCEVRVNED